MARLTAFLAAESLGTARGGTVFELSLRRPATLGITGADPLSLLPSFRDPGSGPAPVVAGALFRGFRMGADRSVEKPGRFERSTVFGIITSDFKGKRALPVDWPSARGNLTFLFFCRRGSELKGAARGAADCAIAAVSPKS